MNTSDANLSVRIAVFSKPGCPKCRTLNTRIDKMLQKSQWDGITKTVFDLGTIEGLVEFCKTDCINPQRLPAVALQIYDRREGQYRYIPNTLSEEQVQSDSYQLYSYLGLQTDYRAGGTITQPMISSILSRAQQWLGKQGAC